MKKRNDRRMAEAATDSQAAPGGPFLVLSGYEAANNSPLRGAIYWPHQADTRRELNAMSDREIRRRVHWLIANTGIARRITRGLAKLLGVLTPVPVTQDEGWNLAAYNNFMRAYSSPQVFDRRGRYNFFTGQVELNRSRFTDGRILTALTSTASGRAQIALYEAHQNMSGGENAGLYEEGILLDRFGRHAKYCLQDGENPSKFAEISSRDCFYYGHYENPGRIHGLSILAHAVPNLTDVVELRGLRKHAAKIHASFGVVVETDAGPAINIPGSGLVGPAYTRTEEAVGLTEEEGGSGSPEKSEVRITWEQLAGSGGIPPLTPGQKIKIIADDRPTANNREFDHMLLDDCILGTDIPAGVLYYVTGKTGPGIRYDMEDVRRWVEIGHHEQRIWCRRFWAVAMAKEIKAGRLWHPRDDAGNLEEYWHQVEWIAQPDMTIDAGRTGALAIQRLKAGLATWGTEWGAQGYHGNTMVDKRIREFARAKAKVAEEALKHGVELTLGEIFPEFKDAISHDPGAVVDPDEEEAAEQEEAQAAA